MSIQNFNIYNSDNYDSVFNPQTVQPEPVKSQPMIELMSLKEPEPQPSGEEEFVFVPLVDRSNKQHLKSFNGRHPVLHPRPVLVRFIPIAQLTERPPSPPINRRKVENKTAAPKSSGFISWIKSFFKSNETASKTLPKKAHDDSRVRLSTTDGPTLVRPRSVSDSEALPPRPSQLLKKEDVEVPTYEFVPIEDQIALHNKKQFRFAQQNEQATVPRYLTQLEEGQHLDYSTPDFMDKDVDEKMWERSKTVGPDMKEALVADPSAAQQKKIVLTLEQYEKQLKELEDSYAPDDLIPHELEALERADKITKEVAGFDIVAPAKVVQVQVKELSPREIQINKLEEQLKTITHVDEYYRISTELNLLKTT